MLLNRLEGVRRWWGKWHPKKSKPLRKWDWGGECREHPSLTGRGEGHLCFVECGQTPASALQAASWAGHGESRCPGLMLIWWQWGCWPARVLLPGTWRVHVEGSTLLPEQEWSHLSSWRQLAQQQKRNSNPLSNLVSAWLLPPWPGSPGKEEAQQGFSPRPTSFPSGHGSSELAWHLFLVPVGRHWQHLWSTKVYHLGSEGPIMLTTACRSELKSFCCLKSVRSLSWKELEKEVRFAGIPRDPKWGEDGTTARGWAPSGSQGESQGRKKGPAGARSSMEQVDLIWGKARVKALIRVLTPSLVNLRLGTCQFSILGCEMILVYGVVQSRTRLKRLSSNSRDNN